MIVSNKSLRTILGLAAVAGGLSACHFSNGENGPAGAAPVVVPGSSGKATYKGGYAGTNTHLLTGSPRGTHPKLDGGAGFPVPNYPPTTLAGWVQGLPRNPSLLSFRQSPYGPILTTSSGKTLYVRLGDAYRISQCVGRCADAFPPFLTNGAPQATGGILPAYIGVLQAATRGEQVSYAQHPLYTYSGDTGPNQYHAEGAGGIWYVISPTGLVQEKPLSASSPTTTVG